MHSNKKDIRFGKRADKYDRSFKGKFLNKFYNMLIDFVKISPNDKLLDIACGTGEFLKRIDKKYKINGFGIDIDDKMIEIARQKCPKLNIATAPCDAMPFDNMQFELITVCMAYHHFENKKEFAKEANRVLAKNGKLYIADLRLPKYLRKALNGLMKHFNIVGEFYTPDEIASFFSEFGFEYNECVTNGRVMIICLTKIN